MKQLFYSFALIMLLSGCGSDSKPTELNSTDETLYFISPQHGATVSSPVKVRFGLNGMGVAPAGTIRENTGHHHLIIDAPLPNMERPIPSSKNYIHFGGGQTETQIELEPGTHTLQLLLGNAYHIPHKEPVISKQITITVE